MPVKLTLTSKQILDKEFQGATPGYNPLQVDQYLDKIIRDYMMIEGNYLMDKNEVDQMKNKMALPEQENQRLLIENERMKSKVSNIKSSDNVTKDNVDLLRRINALETFLFNEGYDINKIK